MTLVSNMFLSYIEKKYMKGSPFIYFKCFLFQICNYYVIRYGKIAEIFKMGYK